MQPHFLGLLTTHSRLQIKEVLRFCVLNFSHDRWNSDPETLVTRLYAGIDYNSFFIKILLPEVIQQIIICFGQEFTVFKKSSPSFSECLLLKFCYIKLFSLSFAVLCILQINLCWLIWILVYIDQWAFIKIKFSFDIFVFISNRLTSSH